MATNGSPSGHFTQLQEIVDFAIEREQEAIDFYTGLAGRVKTKSISDELLNLAGMERQHRQRLEKMDLEAAASTNPRPVTDLKIADYLVQPSPDVNMTWQEILNIAMHRELAAMRLYTELSSRIDDAGARKLFENLAAEESKHKLYFEGIWDEEILIEN